MWVTKIFLAIIGLSGGFMVAGGLFALIIGLGIIPRFSGKTHTGDQVMLYESCVAAGGALGNIFFLYKIPFPVGSWFLAVLGLFFGAYVGGWFMALAEIVNTFPIFLRRCKLVRCLSYVVISVAFGKAVAALIYFWQGW